LGDIRPGRECRPGPALAKESRTIASGSSRSWYFLLLVGRRAACWHGDTSQGNRRRAVIDSPDCLLTTPESLEAILVSSKIDHRKFFKNVQVVVIDELHAFASDD
jgi:ATP-dependent Lhr-like helicase